MQHQSPPIAAKQFRTIQTNTERSLQAIDRRLQGRGDRFSLTSLIVAGLPESAYAAYDSRDLEATLEIANLARESAGGIAANGTWVPLQALARDLTTSNSGGALKVPGTADTIAPGLLPGSAVLGGGATLLTGLNAGVMSLPHIDSTLDASGTAWIGEGSTGPQREPSFGVRTIAPKTLTIEIIISRRLLLNSAASIENELRREVLRRFLAEIDRVVLDGDGDLEPLGLLNDSAIQTLPAAAAPAWAHIVDVEHAVASRTGQLAAPAFLMHPSLRKKLRTTQRAAGLDFILPGDMLLDKPVRASTLVPSGSLIYGDLAELVVGFWGPLAIDLLVDGVTRAREGKVRLIGRAEVGSVARTPGAFAAYDDLVA